MSASETIDELLLRWEAARQEGKRLTPEDLCANCPQLTSELRQRIRAVKEMEQILGVHEHAPERTGPMDAPIAAVDATLDVLPEIPGYELIRVVDQGGMGIVYEARQSVLGRRVAVKMISSVRMGQSHLARFRAEAEASARLQHPNFVQIFDVGQVNGRPFFSMEFVSGGSLAQLLTRERPAPRAAAELVETLAQAIHAAHERGIVHRDLKPANILLTEIGDESLEIRKERAQLLMNFPARTSETSQTRTESGKLFANLRSPVAAHCIPKIADFGLAKLLDDDSKHTHTGEILGTPSYMAPEQASGNRQQIGPATDVYSLGAILYELLAGQPPFRGASPLDSLRLLTTQEPIPPSRLASSIPPDLEAICLKCLEKTPSLRYGSARALADDLRRFLHGQPIVARRSGPIGRVWKWVRRHPQGAALVGALFVLASIPLVLLVDDWRTERQIRLKALEQTPLVREILHRNCFECHGQNPKDIKKKLNVLDHQLLVDPRRRLVVPGAPADSRLFQRIADGSMPPEEDEIRLPRVSEKELTILRDWVLGGAPPLPAEDPQHPTPPVVPYSELAAQAKGIFVEHCYECHKFDEVKGGIKILDHRLLVNVRKVIVPGQPDDSELFHVITSPDENLRMPPPPNNGLSLPEIATIRRWIDAGAPPFPKMK